MNPLLFSATLLFSTLVATASPTLELGQTLKEAIDILGKPMGTIELREKTLLLYPQGEVTLRADRVTEIDLMTEAEFTADQARLSEEREAWLAHEDMRQTTLEKEGQALKAEKLQSKGFAALPAKDRVDYWRSFQMRYPSIDVSEQIATALEGYQSELEELKIQQRIAELEARVAQAEKETALAQLEAKKAREALEANRFESNTNQDTYGSTVIRRNYYYRPPTVTIYTNDHSPHKQHKQHTKPHRDRPSPSEAEPVEEPIKRGSFSATRN